MKMRVVLLSDFISESKQVERVNDWMTYTLPMHRIREFGHGPNCLQCLSERQLTHVEMRDTCIFLLGYDSINGILEDPVSDWYCFIEHLEHSMSALSDARKSDQSNGKPIIDLGRLIKAYRPTRKQRCHDIFIHISQFCRRCSFT